MNEAPAKLALSPNVRTLPHFFPAVLDFESGPGSSTDEAREVTVGCWRIPCLLQLVLKRYRGRIGVAWFPNSRVSNQQGMVVSLPMSAAEAIAANLQNEIAGLRDKLDKTEELLRQSRIEVETLRHRIVEFEARLSKVESDRK